MNNAQESDTQLVINTLSKMILQNAQLVAQEQYSPSPGGPDASDELISSRQEFIKELRSIRERFENLITGILP